MDDRGKQKSSNRNERIKIILENDDPIPEDFPESEFAIVRVWISEFNRKYDTKCFIFCGQSGISSSESMADLKETEVGESKGHVSMELIFNRLRGTKSNGTYLSFGPKEDSLQNPVLRHPAKYIENYKRDLEYMKSKPNYTIIFYTLNVPNMMGALKELTEKPIEKQKWTLTGPRCNMGNGNDSCATKTVKGIRFCWWSLCQCSFAFLRLPFDRVMINSESTDPEMDPTAELRPDKNGEITMSCVSSVFYILHKGGFTSKLLPRKDQRRVIATNVSAASGQSVKNIMHVNLEEVLRNSGYIFHLSVSSVVINPDAFLCIAKYAKSQEILKAENNNINYQIVFKNDNIDFTTSPNQENCQPIEASKETVTLEWVPLHRPN